MSDRRGSSHAVTELAPPVLVGNLYLDAPLPDLDGQGRYRGARLLVWLHGRPLGELVLPLGARPLPAQRLADEVWSVHGERIAKHCADDGISPPASLPVAGIALPGQARCASRRALGAEPGVTVAIATRDRTDSLLRCLASLSRLNYRAFDVVVVDSAPASDTTARALAGRQDWPFTLRYVRAARPGLALAHNEALPAVTGEIVAFTDDDVEVDPEWLSALAAAFTETGAACVTGLIVPAELETRAQLLVEQAGGFARGFTQRRFTRDMPDPEPLFPFTAGRFGSGANMAFRTDWLLGHGGFDPATGAGTPARGGDDLVAFLRTIIDGGMLVYEPAAVVRHWHRRDYQGMRRQAFGYGMGLGAYLAAAIWRRPALLAAMARRAGPAAVHLLGSGSAKNSGRGESFPRELVWRELAGVLAGPLGYARSRWRYRGHRPAGPGGPR
jgi:glycosyltransferase involved in cell wall biosynthesis